MKEGEGLRTTAGSSGERVLDGGLCSKVRSPDVKTNRIIFKNQNLWHDTYLRL